MIGVDDFPEMGFNTLFSGANLLLVSGRVDQAIPDAGLMVVL